jgi:predicted aspartyl protease
MVSRKFVALVGVALLSTAWCSARGRDREPLASNEMAVEIYDGYMLVAQGSANGVTNLRFLLDTGATDSAIDYRLAEKLGLRSNPTKVTSFNKTIESQWTGLREITFGPERASNVRVMIEDLSYFERLGIHIDGLIGLDRLRRKSFLVSYAKKRVTFDPAASAAMLHAPMLVNDQSIRVEAELDGHPTWMMADTGAPLTVFYEDTLKELTVNYHLEKRMDWLSVTGHVVSSVARVPRFQIGGQNLEPEVILVSVSRSKRISGVSGYLGVASLQAKEIAFDFENNQFLWSK